MHLKSLKIFCDVVGRRSFSRAAAENGISQSGASQTVNSLEDHLGVKLIDRTKRPFVLTPEGEVYYQGCRKLVQRYFALEEDVRTLHEEVAGRVSVASIYSIGLSHMNGFVQRFLQAYPKSNVRLQYQHPRRVYELVETNQVDLGVVSYPRSSRPIKATTWREEPMVLVCAPGHRLASQPQVALAASASSRTSRASAAIRWCWTPITSAADEPSRRLRLRGEHRRRRGDPDRAAARVPGQGGPGDDLRTTCRSRAVRAGHVFLPTIDDERAKCKRWSSRSSPSRASGWSAGGACRSRRTRPTSARRRGGRAGTSSSCSSRPADGLEGDAFERQLYLIRKRASHRCATTRR
jgi:DNA-binding transcriptional LysR family regulator